MPRLFEIFGYPLSDRGPEAESNRREARCPFMGQECDGGGNRYSSDIRLGGNPDLKDYFEERNRVFGERNRVSAGVCSIQVREEEPPWIVCPRRLLALGKEKAETRVHQRENEQEVMRLMGHAPGSSLGIWPEVKVKHSETVGGIAKTFDYTFDYVVMPIGRLSAEEMEVATGESWRASGGT